MAAAKAEPERIDAKSRVCDAAGVVVKRGKTVGCVAEPGGVLKERLKTFGRVSDSGCVRSERLITDSHVAAGGVGIERLEAYGGVAIASSIGRKGSLPQSHVEAARGVFDKGIFTYRRVVAAAGIAQECLTIHGSVDTPIGVRLERTKAESRVEGARREY